MTYKAPGKSHREGITIARLLTMFPDNETAEKWFIQTRWPKGPECVFCGSHNVQERKNRKPMPYRCRECRKYFSVKSKSIMEGSKLGLQVWVIAIYLFSTGIKGTSSMKFHRDLGITQKSAWHLAHRIRETWGKRTRKRYSGPVEVDETYIGGKSKNMHAVKRKQFQRWSKHGKSIVVGSKDRETNQVESKIIPNVERPTLHAFVKDNVEPGATVYTDEARAYGGMPFKHESVNHGAGEYVKKQAHTNGIESFWALLKRGYHGTYHHMSEKHLDRYINEFSGRHNNRESDTLDQMRSMVREMAGKRLKYANLISD